MQLLTLIFLILALITSPDLPQPCPYAPLPRLRVGAVGMITAGTDRLNLRALPAVGAGVVAQLYQNTRFEVLTGPSCNGGYSWWRVRLADGRTGWLAEGTWTRYYLAPPDSAATWNNNPRLYAQVKVLRWLVAGLLKHNGGG